MYFVGSPTINREESENGVSTGIRTPVTPVKGECPRPLDDGDNKEEQIGVPVKQTHFNQLV